MALSRVPGDDELFVGGIFTLRRRSALEALGITHIVSVLKYDFKDFEDWEKYGHCSVEVDDVEDENLLGEFGRTNKFIGDALKGGGKVLVHCAMGKSRSVTVTLAYLLSTRPSLNLQSALELVRSSRPIAEPNDGFMAQLTLYASMGCPSDIDAQPAYQRWLYQKDVELSVATGRAPDKLRFEDEEDQGSDPLKGEVGKELKCKKCRKTLATGQYLIPHVPRAEKNSNGNPNDPNDTTDYSPISSLPPTHPLYNATTTTSSTLPTPNPAASSLLPASCRHHFIHPLSWMRATLEREELEGRLECPNTKCGALVGRYAWQGMRCSCGVWVVPGFSLQGARVDEVLKRNAPIIAGGSVAGVRLPPGMRAGGGQNL